MASWSAEQTVSTSLAIQLIEEQFPTLAPVHLELCGEGWDNYAFRVNEQFIFRFPRREIAVELIETEYRLLPRLASRVTLPVPVPQYLGHATAQYPWPFSGYRMLSGKTACSVGFTDEQRCSLAKPLAEFLSSLHAISASVASAWSAPIDKIGRLDFSRRLPVARGNLEKIRGLRLPVDTRRLMEILEKTDISYIPKQIALVHGDFYARHFLVTGAGNLSGVIDWGDIHLGDPAVDIAIAHSFLPPAAHETFRTVYGAISEETWQTAHFRALYHSVYLVLYSHEVQDSNLLRESLQSLQFIAFPG
jgi:aminoglycoside phosphotransferase (APT) family kinase protein